MAVGINTSGFIDAAIFGKPACTVELPELYHGQRGTIHFQHLAREDGGLLRVDETLDDHLRTLGALTRREPYELDAQSMAFVAAFVRPRGLDVAPRDVFVHDMLELADRGPLAPQRRSASVRAARAAAQATAPLLALALGTQPLRAPAHQLLRVRKSRKARRMMRRSLNLARRSYWVSGRVARIAVGSAIRTRRRLALRRRIFGLPDQPGP